MAAANYKRFDVKHGISVNGLPFVDEKRNVVVNDLTVQGVSTVVDTRTITAVDPIISLGVAGKDYTSEGLIGGDYIKFPAEAFDDIAIGDAIKYNSGDISGLTLGETYYVVGKETDPISSNFRSIQVSQTQGGVALTALSETTPGGDSFTLNPLRDLDQDLGIEFNYVTDAPKKGFFGYRDETGNFTFLLETTYGSINVDEDGNPISDDGELGGIPKFTGKKGGIEVKYIKLQPTDALTTSPLPALDIDQTWNNEAVKFQAIDVDIVDTASAADSKYLDFALGGLTNFAVRKDGALTLGAADGSTDAAFNGFLSVDGRNNSDLVLVDLKDTWIDIDEDATLEEYVGINLNVTNTASLGTSKLVNFYSTDNRKYELYWDGHSVQEVEFTGGGAQTAVTVNVTDTSSDANSYLLDLQLADTSVFSVRKDGFVEINGPGEFHDSVTIQTRPNGSGTYEDNTQFQTTYVTLPAGTGTATPINSFASTTFVTGKYLVQIKQGTDYHATEVLLMHANNQVYMTEYATVYNNAIIGILDANISNGNINLTLTPTATAAASPVAIEVRILRTTLAD